LVRSAPKIFHVFDTLLYQIFITFFLTRSMKGNVRLKKKPQSPFIFTVWNKDGKKD